MRSIAEILKVRARTIRAHLQVHLLRVGFKFVSTAAVFHWVPGVMSEWIGGLPCLAEERRTHEKQNTTHRKKYSKDYV